MATKKKDCFIIMPITTPDEHVGLYKGDKDHFTHVLEHLFMPALEEAGFNPIPPTSQGSEIIHADIIKQLSDADLVLCDMSILNPNVFFEFGIRTALDKPVVLVADDKLKGKVPFDAGFINCHPYDSSLEPWHIKDDIKGLVEHIKISFDKSGERNALWKHFGIAQTGVLKSEDATVGAKLDLLTKEVASLKDVKSKSERDTSGNFRRSALSAFLQNTNESEKKKEDEDLQKTLGWFFKKYSNENKENSDGED